MSEIIHSGGDGVCWCREDGKLKWVGWDNGYIHVDFYRGKIRDFYVYNTNDQGYNPSRRLGLQVQTTNFERVELSFDVGATRSEFCELLLEMMKQEDR